MNTQCNPRHEVWRQYLQTTSHVRLAFIVKQFSGLLNTPAVKQKWQECDDDIRADLTLWLAQAEIVLHDINAETDSACPTPVTIASPAKPTTIIPEFARPAAPPRAVKIAAPATPARSYWWFPGTNLLNPSNDRETLGGLMKSPAWRKPSSTQIPLLLGRNIRGDVVIPDLTKVPHLLIAGATGSGKTVCLHALIMSMIYRFSPDELRLILIDPKAAEFRAYAPLPHLLTPCITDTKKVQMALRWVLKEMERRYRVLAKVGVHNLEGFNARPPETVPPVLDGDGNPIPTRLPYIVIVIDELADAMMTARLDVETALARIAQLARAVGIHAIVATQHPSVNVITGVIKANFPCRIAFQLPSQVDSRTVLDGKGAESLLGRGDMLFKSSGGSTLERIQTPFVTDEEIYRVVAHWAAQAPQRFEPELFKASGGGETGVGGKEDELSTEDEALVQQAIEIIQRDRHPTTSYIQRRLRIGYNNAARIMEILEQRGVVGPLIGTAEREIKPPQ